MKSKFNLFTGILLLVLGFVALFRNNDFYIADFILAFVNLAIFYCDNKCDNKKNYVYTQILDWESAKEKLTKAHTDGFLSGLDFSLFIQDLLISKDGYVIDVGNYENVNAEVALRLADRIKKHPIIWKIFFMVA